MSFPIALITLAIVSISPGSPPPAIDANDLNGKPVRLSDLRDQVVIIDFWATWCEPCRKSLPFYQKLHERFGDKGLTIVAVSIDDEEENVRDFVTKHKLGMRVVHDAKKEIVGRYEPPKMPTAYLIGRGGNLVRTYEGFVEEDEAKMLAELEKLLGK